MKKINFNIEIFETFEIEKISINLFIVREILIKFSNIDACTCITDFLLIFYKFFFIRKVLLKRFTKPISCDNKSSTVQPDIDNRWKVYGLRSLTIIIYSHNVHVYCSINKILRLSLRSGRRREGDL